VKPAPFEYHAPATAEEAVELLAKLGDGAKLIAGGQSLIPLLALRLASFEHLIDLRKVPGLGGIEHRDGALSDGAGFDGVMSGGGASSGPASGADRGMSGGPASGATVWIGAGTTEAAIGRSPLVAAKVPLLARATPLIGHFQIRNRGTIGGSLAHADAAAEYPAVALALDAVISTLSRRGERAIPAAEFFTGIWSTALEPDELLTGVTFRVPRGRAGFAIEEFARRRGDFAVAGTAVAIELDADDGRADVNGTGPDAPGGPDRPGAPGAPGVSGARVRRCAIGLFGLGTTPLRAPAAEAALVGMPADEVRTEAFAQEIGRAAMADLDSVPSDSHGSGAYRQRVGAALLARALQRAVSEALDEEAISD
jgi:carbon-monoxide dehydrogenase medium subunit